MTKAVVTITVNNATRPEGAANPVFSYKLSGFVNGDRMTTTATATSTAGPHPISFSVEPLIAANYIFSYVDGTLTVTGGAQMAAVRGN